MAIGFMSFGGMLTGGDEEKKKKNTEVVASSKLEKDTQVKKINITKNIIMNRTG